MVRRTSKAKATLTRDKPISLHGLAFEDALSELLAVKPPKKTPRKKRAKKS
jgi:hypothetical protein